LLYASGGGLVGGWQQLWGENMQDLGICKGEEVGDLCEGGFSMADVDLSFDNYEDIFSCTRDLSSSSFNDIHAGCTSLGQDSVTEEKNQCVAHMQSITDSKLLESTNVKISSIIITACSLSHFLWSLHYQRELPIYLFLFHMMQTWQKHFWSVSAISIGELVMSSSVCDAFFAGWFPLVSLSYLFHKGHGKLILPVEYFSFLQGAMSGAELQVYEEEGLAGQGPGPPLSPPEISEIGKMMSATGLSGCPDMEMQQLVQQRRPTGSSLSLSLSGVSGDSSDYHECTAASSMLINTDSSWVPTSPERGALTHQARDSAMLRYKEKKKTRKYAMNSKP
jgi:hypothetical protein